MSPDRARDGGYDDWLDAVQSGEGFYVACANGHPLLPPRRVCPHCGSRDLTDEPIPESGEIESFTTIHVATPSFEDDAPYTTALAAFGPVTITGVLRGADPEAIEVGDPVGIGVEQRHTTGDRLVVFRPR